MLAWSRRLRHEQQHGSRASAAGPLRAVMSQSGATRTIASSRGLRCFHAAEVNYILFGTAFRLCHNAKLKWHFDVFGNIEFSHANMMAKIRLWELFGDSNSGDINYKRLWANRGFYGWPRSAETPPASKPGCMDCGKSHNSLSYYWYGLTSGGNESDRIFREVRL